MNQSSTGMFGKVFMIVCAFLGVLGIGVFSMSQFGNKTDPNLTGRLLVWGTLSDKEIGKILTPYNQNAKTYSVEYVEIKESEFINKYIQSLANEAAPDLVLIPETIGLPLSKFFTRYDNTQISETTYKDTFVRATHKLFSEAGVTSVPVAIDPLLMYVNTDMLVNAGFQRSPTTWSEIPIFAKKVLELNKDGNLSQRGIALGSLNNITYGKEILNSLLLQVKNDVFQRKVTQTDEGFSEDYFSVFGSNKEDEENQNGKVAEQVFVFFSSFVNPNLDVYSWSKKYSNDRELFAAGNLGIYFGLSGDRAYIDSKNPHIRYEIAPIPIPKGGEGSMRNTGYAKVYGLSMNSKTKKMPLAQKVLNDFLEGNIMKDIVQVYSLAPSKISQITIEQTEKFRDTVYKSADRADIILEEKPDVLKTIFQEILTSLEGSKVTPAQIIVNSQRELQRILEE